MSTRWTDEDVQEAVSASTSFTQALIALGATRDKYWRLQLKADCERLDVNTDHFRVNGARWSTDDLERALARSNSWHEVAQNLGLASHGKLYGHLRSSAVTHGLPYDHIARPVRADVKFLCMRCGKPSWTNRGRFCSRSCRSMDRAEQIEAYVVGWLAGEETGSTPAGMIPGWLKTWLREEANWRCIQCGWGVAREDSGVVPLEVDHIDGDAFNNARANLRVLCPNCHSLTPTFRAANMGNGRAARLLRSAA